MAILHGTLNIPEASGDRIPDSTTAFMDSGMEAISEKRQAWIDTPIEARIELLRTVRSNIVSVAGEWVADACAAKAIEPGTAAEGEEWQAGPWLVLRNLRLLEQSLTDLAGGSPPQLPGKIFTDKDGQVRVPNFPTDIWDRLLFTRFHAHTWMADGVTEQDVVDTQAPCYRGDVSPKPSACVVLGAGNVSSIAPTDTLYKLFVELKTVMLKVNPVNEYVGPHLERAFAPLVELGVLRFAYGGTDVGKHLTAHPLADAIHMTGSDKTHDAIVFGTGDEGARNKASATMKIDKEITSELGSVTPVIVVPGPWSESDFSRQRDNLTTMLTNNAGFNCIATRVIVQHAGWEHRQRLLDELAQSFSSIRTRAAYYPGASDRYEQFTDSHPEAERIGVHTDDRLPWTLIRDVDPSNAEDICFATEAFTSVVSEVGLDAADPAAFVRDAVEFCNSTLWGTLGVSILVHPRSSRRTKKAVKQAIKDLEYGTVAVNHWSALGFAFMSTPWGGYPGAVPTDIQSGVGFVHNTYLLSNIKKVVLRGPWRVIPKPPWSPTHRRSLSVFKALTRFEEKPGIWRLLPLLFHSVRG